MRRANYQRGVTCTVRHALPGRVRLDCPALAALNGRGPEVEERLRRLPGVRDVRLTPLIGSALVHFDPACSSSEHIRRATVAAVGAVAPVVAKRRRARPADMAAERQVQEESADGQLWRVVGASLVGLYTWLIRPAQTAPTLVGRLLAAPALTALALSATVFRSGLAALVRDRRPNADTLTSTAVLAAVLTGQGGSALAIVWLTELAELLTATTIRRTRGAIRDLLTVGQERVRRLRADGSEEQVDLAVLQPGDRILVLPGEKISVDGIVEQGDAAVDQASLTGEFLPAYKTKNAGVLAGTVVKRGRLTIRAEKVGDETAVARLVKLVEEASARQTRVQGLADQLSARLLPAHFGLALLVYLLTGNASRALTLLVVDYSCSLRLSTATALAATVYTAARHGVLIKGGQIVEQLAQADTLVLDKTGTVTAGEVRVTDVVPLRGGTNRTELVRAAAAAEESSPHPLAAGIVGKAHELGAAIPRHHDSHVILGRGVSTQTDDGLIQVGNHQFMTEAGVPLQAAANAAQRLAESGAGVVYVARNGELLGLLGVRDPLRHHIREAVQRLRRLGIREVQMLTGDTAEQARVVAAQIEVDRVEAGLLPEDKIGTVRRLQEEGRRVIMVGDGSNDAPALAAADVGIAVGAQRTDLAMEAADVVLAGDDPLLLPAVIGLGRRMMGIVRQNFALALGVNTLGIALGATGLLPVFWCAVLHNSTTLGVVLNSGRLLLDDVKEAA